MSEQDEQSPYGPGFVAACIMVGALLVCGAVLVISNLTSGRDAAVQLQSAEGAPTEAPSPPATPSGPASGGASTAGSRGDCSLPAGDQAVPATAPAVDGWEVSRRVVVPRSAAYGPGRIDADGLRRCFAHSPTGAVFAAYNAIAALADPDEQVAVARRLMLPGPDTDALIREVQQDPSVSGYAAPQPTAYRVVDAEPDHVTVMLAVPVESAYVSLALTLVWHDGDWRVQPPARGTAVGAPYAQLRDLSDFVSWSGV